VVSDPQLRDLGAHGSHDSGDLVTKDRRRGNEVMRGEQEIGVTKPRRSHLNEDLAAHGSGDVDVVEVEPAADGIENERFHAANMRPSLAACSSSVVKEAPTSLDDHE
jgi:hypothetical protein